MTFRSYEMFVISEMIKSSVIEILRTFSDEELLSFEEFIRTPFHNKNAMLIRFFKILKEYHPKYKGVNFTKENLYLQMTGKSKYKDTYIRNLLSDLHNLAEKFIQINMIGRDNSLERLLIEELKNRDLYEIAAKKIKSFEKKVTSEKLKDHEYYLNKNFIYEMNSFLIVDKTLTDNFRKEQISCIIKLYMITLMESSFYLRVEEQRVRIKHRFDFLKHVLKYMEMHLNEFEDSPLLMIYFYLWQCYFCEDDERYFLKAKEYFKKNFSALTKIDKKNIYSVMQVFYINKIDKGETEYNKKYLDFLLEMLNMNILSHKNNDSIGLNLYRNIIILCLMLNETDILKKFILKYISFVEKESRHAVLTYSNSQLYFLQGNFEKALELCGKINFNDLLIKGNDNLYFKNDIKTLTLKCLYELNAFENTISQIDTFKHFIRNSKLIKDDVRKRFINFLNIVNRLIKLKNKFDASEFEDLKLKFKNTKKIIHSAWISAKICELENKNV
ncbi:MAG TPA: hypothetical protein DCY06_08405 [Bacteroidetes bacterium]|nr:hypothetical protein [Bacteroidota bacterium]